MQNVQKVCTQSSFSLSASYDSLQRKLIWQSQLIKSQTSRRDYRLPAVEKAVSDGQAEKIGKGPRLSQRRSDSRTFRRSKAKEGWNQPTKCMKAKPMGKSNNDPPGHFVTFSAANQIREAVTTKYRGFGEKHISTHSRIFKR